MPTVINGFFILVICGALFLLARRYFASIGWMISNLDYQCTNCGGYIYLDPWQAALAPHSMGSKWVRCPHCGQMTWARPIRK